MYLEHLNSKRWHLSLSVQLAIWVLTAISKEQFAVTQRIVSNN